jgi:hypothetical protein
MNVTGTIPTLVDGSVTIFDRYFCLIKIQIVHIEAIIASRFFRITILIFKFFNFSHAILLYLVEKYAKNDDLYPKNDFLLRTKINEILFYEASCLFARFYDLAVIYRIIVG